MRRAVFSTNTQLSNDPHVGRSVQGSRAEHSGSATHAIDRPPTMAKAPARRITCLTEMSVGSLLAGALGISVVLWLAIFAVL